MEACQSNPFMWLNNADCDLHKNVWKFWDHGVDGKKLIAKVPGDANEVSTVKVIRMPTVHYNEKHKMARNYAKQSTCCCLGLLELLLTRHMAFPSVGQKEAKLRGRPQRALVCIARVWGELLKLDAKMCFFRTGGDRVVKTGREQ